MRYQVRQDAERAAPLGCMLGSVIGHALIRRRMHALPGEAWSNAHVRVREGTGSAAGTLAWLSPIWIAECPGHPPLLRSIPKLVRRITFC